MGLIGLKLSPEVKGFSSDADDKINLDEINEHHQVIRDEGDFGATGAGAVGYHLKTSVEENYTWICNWQHLLKITRTLKDNIYFNKALICLEAVIKKTITSTMSLLKN